jgi:hypothetical protein
MMGAKENRESSEFTALEYIMIMVGNVSVICSILTV